MGNTVKIVGNTVSDASKAMGEGMGGGMLKAGGHLTKSPFLKQLGNKQLKEAKYHTTGALIGELNVKASLVANISNPYNMSLSSVNTDFKVTRGIVGLVVHSILSLTKSDLRHAANAVLEVKLKHLIEDLRLKVKQLDFVKNPDLNKQIQEAWEPQNISAHFTGDNGLYLALNSTVVKNLIVKFQSFNISIPSLYTIHTRLCYKSNQYPVKVIIDLNGRNIYAVMYNVRQLLDVLNGELRAKLQKKIGKTCCKCNTSIDVANINVNVNANLSLRVPL